MKTMMMRVMQLASLIRWYILFFFIFFQFFWSLLYLIISHSLPLISYLLFLSHNNSYNYFIMMLDLKEEVSVYLYLCHLFKNKNKSVVEVRSKCSENWSCLCHFMFYSSARFRNPKVVAMNWRDVLIVKLLLLLCGEEISL